MLDNLSLTVPVPCIQGSFGDKLITYQTQVKPSQILNLLGHDPRSKNWKKLPDEQKELYEYLQRKTDKGRRDGIRDYILNRIAPGNFTIGAFPAISIGILKPAEFQPYDNSGNISKAVGTLQLDISSTNLRILLDGLGRVTGTLDLIEEGNLKAADSFAFPVTIYAPSKLLGEVSALQLGQLFHDFNFLASPVATAQAIDLDQSDIYVTLTNKLAASAVVKQHGGVEDRAMSLGKKSTALVAKPVLLRFVRGACEGASLQHTLRDTAGDNPNLTVATFSNTLTQIEDFLDTLANGMGSRFSEKDSLHLTAIGWNALGIVYHDIHYVLARSLDRAIAKDITNRIASINWSRSNPEWVGLILVPDKKNPNILKIDGGQRAITKLVNFIREKSGLAAHLAAIGLRNDREDETALVGIR